MKSLIGHNKLINNYGQSSRVTKSSNNTSSQGLSSLSVPGFAFDTSSSMHLNICRKKLQLETTESIFMSNTYQKSISHIVMSDKELWNQQSRNYSKRIKDHKDDKPRDSKSGGFLGSDIKNTDLDDSDISRNEGVNISTLNNEVISTQDSLKSDTVNSLTIVPLNDNKLLRANNNSLPNKIEYNPVTKASCTTSSTFSKTKSSDNQSESVIVYSDGASYDYNKDQQNDSKNKHSKDDKNNSWFTADWKLVVSCVSLVISSIGLTISFATYKSNQKEKNRSKLDKLVEKCSANYISQIAKNGNFEEINNIEKTIDTMISDLKEKSWIMNKLSNDNSVDNISKDLPNLLYLINSLSNYYLFQHHDHIKAREVLMKGNEIVANHIDNNKHKHFPDSAKFKSLSNEHKLEVLKATGNGLAEVYTMHMYLLGRTYIYEGKNKSLGSEYFELSYYLGDELGLFVSILTVREGLNAIIEEDINELIKNPAECENAREKTKNVIGSLNKIRRSEDETKTYIEGYKLRKNDSEQKKIKLSEDNYHQVECAEQLIKYYSKLMAISISKEEKTESFKVISDILFGVVDEHNVNHLGLIERLNDNSFPIPNQKKASVYNTLGNMINICESIGVEANEIHESLAKRLQLDADSNVPSQKLEGMQACKMFAKAYSMTMNSNFTKIDAYNAYCAMLEHHPELCKHVGTLSKPHNSDTRIFNDPITWECFRQFDQGEDQVDCAGV